MKVFISYKTDVDLQTAHYTSNKICCCSMSRHHTKSVSTSYTTLKCDIINIYHVADLSQPLPE